MKITRERMLMVSCLILIIATSVLFLMGFLCFDGFGPIIVFLSSLAICVFSVKGIQEYHFRNKTKHPKFMFFIMRIVLRIKNNPRKIKQLLETVGVRENMKILDYGCGIGSYSIEAAKIIGKSGIVIGVDIDKNMLKTLEKRMKPSGATNIKPLLINSLEDVEDRDFDFILLIDVLQLLEDKTGIIDSLLGRLSTNGKLLIKFEHFNKNEINSLLNSWSCSDKKLIYRSYWLLSN